MTAKDNTGTKRPLIILTGPTAVGKTALSIGLAKAIQGEIISADSMQIYKYMDIGSAKITIDEMQGVKHYLVDEVTPDYVFSVSEFQKRADDYIQKINKDNKKVLVTGGTGLYLNSLIYNIRALEVCLSGEKMNDFSKDLKFNEKYNPIIIVLNREREHLYERINKRVDIMMDNGLIDEVKNLLKMGYTKDMISMQGIGYKEIIKYLDGEYTLDEAIDIIKRDSRRYAKRQLTWFRRYDDAKWFNLDEYSDSQVLKNDIIMHIEKML